MAKRRQTRQKRKSRIKQRERRQQLIIFGSLGGILVLFIGIVAYNIINAPPDVSDARLEREAVLGQSGATVQIVEYGAYGCPHCKDFHESGEIERLIDTYGDVQFIFRNAPFISGNDRRGAEAAQCALDQSDEAFWAMHDAIFSLPTDEFVEAEDGDLVDLAREAGLDAEALEHCLDQRTHERTVDYWENNRLREGVFSTPTLFVNNQRVDEATLEAAVQAALGSGG
jgi:protein-disulfide isomerase